MSEVTVQEIATSLGLTPSTILYHIQQRNLAAAWRFGRWLIDRDEYERWRKLPRKPGPKPRSKNRKRKPLNLGVTPRLRST